LFLPLIFNSFSFLHAYFLCFHNNLFSFFIYPDSFLSVCALVSCFILFQLSLALFSSSPPLLYAFVCFSFFYILSSFCFPSFCVCLFYFFSAINVPYRKQANLLFISWFLIYSYIFLYDLFNDAVINSDCVSSNDRCHWIINWGHGKKHLWPNFGYDPGLSWRDWGKPATPLPQLEKPVHRPRFKTDNSQIKVRSVASGNTVIPHLKGADPVHRHKRHGAYLLRLTSHATGLSATPRSSDLELSHCHTHTSSASPSTATIIIRHSATVNYVEKLCNLFLNYQVPRYVRFPLFQNRSMSVGGRIIYTDLYWSGLDLHSTTLVAFTCRKVLLHVTYNYQSLHGLRMKYITSDNEPSYLILWLR
jgi:hypothetical protein